jgi:hypothetical protein
MQSLVITIIVFFILLFISYEDKIMLVFSKRERMNKKLRDLKDKLKYKHMNRE